METADLSDMSRGQLKHQGVNNEAYDHTLQM